jgi:hypothetical protein
MFNLAAHTMKKVVLALVTVIFVIVLLASCNKNVCPAYVMDNKTEQVENNG